MRVDIEVERTQLPTPDAFWFIDGNRVVVIADHAISDAQIRNIVTVARNVTDLVDRSN